MASWTAGCTGRAFGESPCGRRSPLPACAALHPLQAHPSNSSNSSRLRNVGISVWRSHTMRNAATIAPSHHNGTTPSRWRAAQRCQCAWRVLRSSARWPGQCRIHSPRAVQPRHGSAKVASLCGRGVPSASTWVFSPGPPGPDAGAPLLKEHVLLTITGVPLKCSKSSTTVARRRASRSVTAACPATSPPARTCRNRCRSFNARLPGGGRRERHVALMKHGLARNTAVTADTHGVARSCHALAGPGRASRTYF